MANFVDVDLRRADLTGAVFSHGEFPNSRVTKGLFHGTDLEEREFIGTNVEGAEFFGANMKDVGFRETTMGQGQVFGATPGGTEFFGSGLTGAGFYRSRIVRRLSASQQSRASNTAESVFVDRRGDPRVSEQDRGDGW